MSAHVHRAEIVSDKDMLGMDAEALFQCKVCLKKQRGFTTKCPSCRSRNSFVICEEQVDEEGNELDTNDGTEEEEETTARPVSVSADKVKFNRHARIRFGMEGLDEILGNPYGKPKPFWGMVHGCVASMTGDPGVGKSTMILEACLRAAASGVRVYHADAEEPKENVVDRARRIMEATDIAWGRAAQNRVLKNLRLMTSAQYIEEVFEDCDNYSSDGPPDMLSVNSLNTYYAHGPNGEPLETEAGNPTQLRRIAKVVYKYAHGNNGAGKLIATWLVCQVDKEGDMIGPREVAHAVDAAFHIKKAEDYKVSGMTTMQTYENKNRFGNAAIEVRYWMDPAYGILRMKSWK